MRRLEIIHLRSSEEPLERLADWIRDSMRPDDDQMTVVTLYRRFGLETDVSVHIHHLEASGADEPSSLGLHLACALKAYGLVEHTLWGELV